MKEGFKGLLELLKIFAIILLPLLPIFGIIGISVWGIHFISETGQIWIWPLIAIGIVFLISVLINVGADWRGGPIFWIFGLGILAVLGIVVVVTHFYWDSNWTHWSEIVLAFFLLLIGFWLSIIHID